MFTKTNNLPYQIYDLIKNISMLAQTKKSPVGFSHRSTWNRTRSRCF